jgi:hypothetical protein
MKKFLTIFGLAAVLAVAGAGITSNQAFAGHGHHHGHHSKHWGGWGWGFGGLATGLALGYALNQPSAPAVQYVPYPVYPYPVYNPYYVPAPMPAAVPVYQVQ